MARIISIPRCIVECYECRCLFECSADELERADKTLDRIGMKKTHCPRCSNDVLVDIELDEKEHVEKMKRLMERSDRMTEELMHIYPPAK